MTLEAARAVVSWPRAVPMSASRKGSTMLLATELSPAGQKPKQSADAPIHERVVQLRSRSPQPKGRLSWGIRLRGGQRPPMLAHPVSATSVGRFDEASFRSESQGETECR